LKKLNSCPEINKINEIITSLCPDPKNGLNKELFHLISSLTPIINVDLLIKNDNNQTLLTWRDDEFYGPGWHIPGGVIRFKESINDRIQLVAKNELDLTIQYNPSPITMREVFNNDRDIRGHFISLLYRCENLSEPAEHLRFSSTLKNGFWKWHDNCPIDIIKVHEPYRDFIDDSI